MLFVLGVLVVVIGVALSIALHEIGHLVPAKKFGVKVTQYMVGFGPTIWSRRRGETEYGIKAIPLGGYVRMIGMLPPRPGDAPGELRTLSTGRFSQMVDQARADSMEEVRPGDEDRVFYKLSPGKKIIIMLGGPIMNLVIAAVLLTGVITIYGLPQVAPRGRPAVHVRADGRAHPAGAPARLCAGRSAEPRRRRRPAERGPHPVGRRAARSPSGTRSRRRSAPARAAT